MVAVVVLLAEEPAGKTDSAAAAGSQCIEASAGRRTTAAVAAAVVQIQSPAIVRACRCIEAASDRLQSQSVERQRVLAAGRTAGHIAADPGGHW